MLLVPTFVPFFFHWYVGVEPPFTGVAVKVTEVPEQIVVALAPIETETVFVVNSPNCKSPTEVNPLTVAEVVVAVADKLPFHDVPL